MGATTNYGLRYPELTDAPNGPLAFQNLAADVEAALSGSPFGHVGITSGFVTITNGLFPTMASQVLRDGMIFSSNGLVVPKTGLYEIVTKSYFTGGSAYSASWGPTLNSTAIPPTNIVGGSGLLWKADSADYSGWAVVRTQLNAGDTIRLYMKGTASTWGTNGYDGSFLEVLFLQP